MGLQLRSILVLLALHFLGLILGFGFLYAVRLTDKTGDLALQILIASVLAGTLSPIIFWKGRFGQSKTILKSIHKDVKVLIILLFASSVIFFNLNMLVHTVLNTDRSRSIFILSWVECSPKKTTKEEMQQEIGKELGEESLRAFNKRLNEHIKRGLIKEENGTVRLTFIGESVYGVSKVLTTIYDLKGPLENALWSKEKNICWMGSKEYLNFQDF